MRMAHSWSVSSAPYCSKFCGHNIPVILHNPTVLMFLYITSTLPTLRMCQETESKVYTYIYSGDKTNDVVCKHMMCCGVMDRPTSLATVQHVKRNHQYNNHVNSKQ